MQSCHQFKIPSHFRVKKSKSGKESDKNITAPEKSYSSNFNQLHSNPTENTNSDPSTMIVEMPFDEPQEDTLNNLPNNLLEDDKGRLEQRIAAPWDRDIEDNAEESPEVEKKLSRHEERKKRKSMKIRPKEKIGQIDIDVLQKELSKS